MMAFTYRPPRGLKTVTDNYLHAANVKVIAMDYILLVLRVHLARSQMIRGHSYNAS